MLYNHHLILDRRPHSKGPWLLLLICSRYFLFIIYLLIICTHKFTVIVGHVDYCSLVLRARISESSTAAVRTMPTASNSRVAAYLGDIHICQFQYYILNYYVYADCGYFMN